jgi:chemotaxis protein CheD
MALLIVGIGDCKVSNDPSDVLVTHALGSCIAVLLYDPIARVAGLLHFMLPESSLDPEKAGRLPFVYADTGIPLLIQNACQLGGLTSRMIFAATGGAQMLESICTFNIGRKNHLAMRAIFGKFGITVRNEEIGGANSRAVSIDVANGRVQLRVSRQTKQDKAIAQVNSCLM